MAKDEGRTVSVSSDAIEASVEPQFIVEHEGKFYVSVAVLEFDPKHPKLREVHKKGIERVASAFKGGRKVGAVMTGADTQTFIDTVAVQTYNPKPNRGRNKP